MIFLANDIRFGVYGYPKNFLESTAGKKRENIFEWLNELHLQAFLLDWTYGTSMTDQRAERYVSLAHQYDVKIYLKAPKDIDFISSKEEDQKKSLLQLKRAIDLAQKLACHDLIFSLGNTRVTTDRSELTTRLVEQLKPVIENYPDLRFHIEPSMRSSMYGNLDELLQLSKKIKGVFPSFNLVHLHALYDCTLIYPERIVALFQKVSTVLGKASLNKLVVQISPLSYEHGRFIPKTFGEIKLGQLSFFDSNFEYFPKASDYIQAIRSLNITPTTFSNTFETEDIGALRLRDSYFYQKLKEES